MKKYLLDTPHEQTISIIPAPFDVGQPYHGVKSAPNLILSSAFEQMIERNFYEVHYAHSLLDFMIQSPTFKTMKEFLKISQTIFLETFQQSQAQKFCLTLGGDHSIAFGSIAGLLQTYPDLCVIWFDAHGDMNTPDTSPSGNFHGMPLAALLNQKPELWLGQCPWFKNKLDAKRLVLVGIRDLDPAEELLIEKYKIKIITAEEIQKKGIPAAWKEIKTHLSPYQNSPVHLSFDIDGIDPSFAPATGTPVEGGVSVENALTLVKNISESLNLIGMDLVEINPALPIHSKDIQKTIALSQKIICEALKIPSSELEKLSHTLNHPERVF